jgi:transposase
LIGVDVHAANESDSKSCLKLILSVKDQHPTLRFAHVDQGYRGDAVNILEANDFEVTIPVKIAPGFNPEALRWKIERLIAWLKNCRRLCVEHERRVASSAAFVKLAGAGLMLRRLFREPIVWKNRQID